MIQRQVFRSDLPNAVSLSVDFSITHGLLIEFTSRKLATNHVEQLSVSYASRSGTQH
jgi:hypothetical protein